MRGGERKGGLVVSNDLKKSDKDDSDWLEHVARLG